MKKMIALLLVGTLVLSMTACGSSKKNESSSGNAVDTITGDTESEVSEEKTDETDPEEGVNSPDEMQNEENAEDLQSDDNKEGDKVTVNETDTSGKNSAGDKNTASDKKDETGKNTSSNKGDSGNKKPSGDKDSSESGANDKEEGPKIIAPSAKNGTMGKTLWNTFKDSVTGNPKIGMEELANVLITDPVIQFMGMASSVEVGAEYFTGFGEYQITGYDSAAIFAPMIGSIAFVGYVFDLSDGTDVSKFIKKLKQNCDPGWNICVTADQTAVGAVDDKVFFVMCPAGTE